MARGDDAPTFELAHERLIDGWPALAGWLSDAAGRVAAHARLAAAVASWERLGRAREGLWGVRQLADLELLAHEDLAPVEAGFARASRRAVMRRRLARAAAAVAIPATVLAFYAGAQLVARRDLDRHIATNVGEADRQLARAREARDASAQLRTDAFARFDAGDADRGEAAWAVARARTAEAQAGYAQAARLLEAAFLLDTGRGDVRRALAELTYERLQLAEREHRPSERSELGVRLGLYDPGGDLAARLAAPARLIAAIEPPGTALALAPAGATSETPLASSATLPPGSYVVVARAPGRATVRIPIALHAGEERRVALELPRADAVPAGFVYVPVGTFLSGSSDDEPIRQFHQAAPMHELRTEAFLIGRTEVTYAQWIEFLEALPPKERARRTPRIKSSPTVHEGGVLELRQLAGGAWELHVTPAGVPYAARAGAPIVYRERASRARQDWLRLPVSGIAPKDAQAYAAWLDRTGRVPRARLCTEREWERASRGADGRPYPHGERLAPDDANFDATYGRRDAAFGPDAVGRTPRRRARSGWSIRRATSGRSAARPRGPVS